MIEGVACASRGGRKGDEAHVDFRAEMDCLVALSACPESGRGGPVRVEIFEE